MGASPAVFAGLLGSSVVPGPAQAGAAINVAALVGDVAPLVGGAAVGALVGGVAYVVLTHLEPGDVVAAIHIQRGERRTGERREAAAEPAGRHYAAAVRPGVSHAALHFRTSDWEQTGTIRVQEVVEPRAAAHVATGKATMRHARPFGSRDVDYAEVAEGYVARVTLAERMATAARGVASVLGERIGASMMEDVPVIRRADGSAADMGTTWWAEAARESGRDALEAGAAAEAMVVPDEIRYVPNAQSLDDTAPQSLELRPEPKSATVFKRDSAARRLASVELGMFPERRSSAELDGRQDIWAMALAALDEKASSPIDLVFEDVVGDIDTLDEPDGLEMPTDFIPFRAPAGHPEVVDTETYVDYLIRQEFTKNPSSAVRRNAREYLRVIEGGTAGMLKAPQAGAAEPAPRGKHFRRETLPVALEA